MSSLLHLSSYGPWMRSGRCRNYQRRRASHHAVKAHDRLTVTAHIYREDAGADVVSEGIALR
jgi:hypothetical protein